MSYGTLQDTPPAAGGARIHFAPGPSRSASSNHPDEDESSDTQNGSAWKRAGSGLKNFYNRNFGLFLVFLAQTCGSVVSWLSSDSALAMFSLTDHGVDEHGSQVASK